VRFDARDGQLNGIDSPARMSVRFTHGLNLFGNEYGQGRELFATSATPVGTGDTGASSHLNLTRGWDPMTPQDASAAAYAICKRCAHRGRSLVVHDVAARPSLGRAFGRGLVCPALEVTLAHG